MDICPSYSLIQSDHLQVGRCTCISIMKARQDQYSAMGMLCLTVKMCLSEGRSELVWVKL